MSKKIKSPTDKKKDNHIALKIVTVLFIVLMVAALFLPRAIISGNMDLEASIFMELLGGIKDAIGSGNIIDVAKTVLRNYRWECFAVVMAIVSVLPSIIVMVTRKASPVWFRIGSIATTITGAMYLFRDLSAEEDLQAFTIVYCAIAAITLLHMIVTIFGNKEKKGAIPFLVTLLTIGAIVVSAIFTDTIDGSKQTVFNAFFAYAVSLYDFLLRTVLNLVGLAATVDFPLLDSLVLQLLYGAVAMFIVNTLFGYVQVGNIKPNFFTVIRYLAQLGLTGAVLAFMILDKNYAIVYMVLAGISLVSFVLTIVALTTGKKKKEKAPAPITKAEEETNAEMEQIAMFEEAPAVEAEEKAEEPAEEEESGQQLAIDVPENEDDEKIETAEGAQELTPSYGRKKSAEAEKLEKDHFYHSLSPAGKREFKKVFLGDEAPEFLPEYKVGEDNTEFFDCMFVRLGKVRKIMSDDLLGEMYDYVMEH